MPIYKVNNLKEQFKEFLEKKFQYLLILKSKLRFGIILVGEDFSSIKYAHMKLKLAHELSIEAKFFHFPNDIERVQIQEILDDYSSNGGGLLFQLPIRSDLKDLVYQTPLNSDVDLLSNNRSELLKQSFLPPTIGAIDLILKDIFHFNSADIESTLKSNLSLKGIVVAVIGQGVLVGSPLIEYLMRSQATIISVNIDTVDPKKLTKQADILISATGKENLVDQSWLKESYDKNGVTYPIVIDAGTSEGKIEAEDKTIVSTLVGDVDKQSVENHCTLVGVPGGVGPITVRYIFWNLYRLNQL